MNEKCNTTGSKLPITPIQHIYTSDFVDNEEQWEMGPHPDQEIRLNIATIRDCKLQTEELVEHMQQQLGEQHWRVGTLQELQNREKEKSRQYRQKYHQTVLQLRKKEEICQNLERKYCILEEKYEFVRDFGQRQIGRLLMQEQSYKQKIHSLESQLEQLQGSSGHFENSPIQASRAWAQEFKDTQESTFI